MRPRGGRDRCALVVLPPPLPPRAPRGRYASLKHALDAVIDFLGLTACDNSANPAEGARTHTAHLSGLFLGGVQVFAIVNLRSDGPKTVGMRLTVRSTDMGISQFVAASVA